MRTAFISEWKTPFPVACRSLLNTFSTHAVPAQKQFLGQTDFVRAI